MNAEETVSKKLYCEGCITAGGMEYRTTFLSWIKSECSGCKEIAFCVQEHQLKIPASVKTP